MAGESMEEPLRKPITLTLSLAQPLFSNSSQALAIQVSETFCISSGLCSCQLFQSEDQAIQIGHQTEPTLDGDNTEETRTAIARRYLHIDQKR